MAFKFYDLLSVIKVRRFIAYITAKTFRLFSSKGVCEVNLSYINYFIRVEKAIRTPKF